MSPRRFLTVCFCAVLATSAIAETEAPVAPPPLRLLAYNIKHGRGMDGKVAIKRIAAVIAKLNPDLVALQEVDKNCERSGNEDIAAELGKLLEMEHRFAKFMDFQGGEYGLAVLSKFPIKNSVRHPLPLGAEPRCALEISVQPDHWPSPLSFVSIHHDWTSEEIRVKQVTALLEAFKDHKNPVVLAGDFNGTRKGSSLKLLQDHEWIIQKKTQGEAVTCPSIKPSTEIDFFITRNLPPVKIEHYVVNEQMASDHRPIFAALSLSK